ncbi:unnamed protein product [Notodromas monacha]|uniref:Spermatogenesis-associated protein 13 n=1 Tax=Notodromas monacha TaxID=399045 RepID=A0A7R9GC70_9CRUS|nr:unnamed protein product [Notodromas monacha]CAG0915521.1 unnamed protein product [Notodromas monacha]
MEVIPEEKGFSLKKVWNSRPGRRQSVTARFYVHFKSPDDVMKEHEQASLPRAMSETRLQRRASLLLPWRKGVDSGFQSTTSFPAPQPQRHLDEETPAHADVIAPSISRSPRRILPSSSAAAVREHAGTTIRAPTPYAIPVPLPHRPAPPPPTTSGQHLLNKGATTNTRPKSAVYQTGATSGAVVVVTALTAGAIAGNNQALGARLACAGPQYQHPWDSTNRTDWRRCSSSAAAGCANAAFDDEVQHRRQQQQQQSTSISALSKRLSGDSGIMMMCDAVPTDVQAKNRQSQSTLTGAYSLANNNNNNKCVSGLCQHAADHHLCSRQQQEEVVQQVMLGAAASSGSCATVSRQCFNQARGDVADADGSDAVLQRVPAAAAATATAVFPRLMLLSNTLPRPAGGDPTTAETRNRVYAKNKDSKRRFQQRNGPSQQHPTPMAELVLPSVNPLLWRSSSQPSDLNVSQVVSSSVHPSVVAGQQPTLLSSEASAAAAAAFRARSMRRHQQSRRRCRNQRRSVAGVVSDDDVLDGDFLETNGLMLAEALWDHSTTDADELAFRAGDVIEVLDTSFQQWWWGELHHQPSIGAAGGCPSNNNNNNKPAPAGWFPAAFVRVTTGLNRRSSILLSHDQVRGNIIKEIISSEKEFLKNLCDIKQGYLHQVRRRPDMFTKEHVSTIFGNIEALYEFQSEFVGYLESKINTKQPHKSCVGECFKKYRTGFKVYTEYCNNHPSAVATLQELNEDPNICHFFEACRLLQKMIDISLDGFLLTPVQRICKYPLQLAELAKYTKPDHLDHHDVLEALEEMRGAASAGSSAVSQKSKDLTLFLFDHLLVYCRRDLLKKTSFVWKGKIPLDECRIEDCPDGKDEHLGVPLKNAWKVVNTVRSHYFLFYTRTAEEKLEWMRAFGRERAQVRQDLEQGIVFTEREKEDARRAALATRTNSKFNKKPKGKPSKVKLDPDVMASFMRQMNPASYSAAGSTTTTTNNTIPHHHHPRMVHTTGSLSRLPHTSSGGGPSQQVMHYRNDVRYHSNSASSSSSMSNTSTSTSTGPRTVVMERTHRKDMRMYVGMDAEDEDEDGEDAWHSTTTTTTTTNNGANTMPNTTTNTNSLSKKKSAWFNFGQKRSTTASTISTSRELPANSTFYTTA